MAVTDADREAIVALGSDLPTLWQAETTTNADRKQMLRLVIRDVIVDGKRAHGQVWVQINWQTGPMRSSATNEACRTTSNLLIWKRYGNVFVSSMPLSRSMRRSPERLMRKAIEQHACIAPSLAIRSGCFVRNGTSQRSKSMKKSTILPSETMAPNLLDRRCCGSAGSLPRNHSQMAEGGQTHWMPARQRHALEGILDRRRYRTAPRMASTSQAIKERGIMTHSRTKK